MAENEASPPAHAQLASRVADISQRLEAEDRAEAAPPVPEPKAVEPKAAPPKEEPKAEAKQAEGQPPEPKSEPKEAAKAKPVVSEADYKAAKLAEREAKVAEREAAIEKEAEAVRKFAAAKDDPAAFMEWVEENVPREKVAEFFMLAGEEKDRALVKVSNEAKAAAKRVSDLENSIKSGQEAQRVQELTSRAHREFLSARDGAKDKYPLVSKVPQDLLIKAGEVVADQLTQAGKEWGFGDVLDILEGQLSELGKAFVSPAEEPKAEPKEDQRKAAVVRKVSQADAAESSGSGHVNGGGRRMTKQERFAAVARKFA